MKSNNFKQLNGHDLKIAIVRSRFNEAITQGLLDGAKRALEKSGVISHVSDVMSHKSYVIVDVPGAFEIPLQVERLAKSKKFDAIVTLGAIIKGETKHDEFIANAVIPSILQTSLQYNVPVLLGIVTPLNMEQAKARSAANDHNVGYQAVLAAVEVCGIIYPWI